MNILYENIVRRCEEKDVKPGRMCRELGLSRGMMTDLKNGRKKTLSVETLSKIADYLDTAVDDLLGESGGKPARADDDAVKFALFGTTDIDDEMLQEIKSYARFKLQQQRDQE